MNNVISEYLKKQFEWGVSDCCMFAADIILAKSGVDLADGYRGTYTSKSESVDAIAEFDSLVELLDSNFDRIYNINLAQRGDVVTFKGGNGVGVIWSGCILSMNPDHKGLVKALDEVEFVWRITNV